MPNGHSRDPLNQQREPFFDRLHSSRNWLGFALRNFLRWEPGAYLDTPVTPQGMLKPQAQARAAELLQQYPDLASLQSRQRYAEALTYLDWLDVVYQAAPEALSRIFVTPEPFHWLDVGAKNWAYVDALYACIQANRTDTFRLDGIELDPNRRYLNFKTRRQAALAHSQAFPNARYHTGNVLQWTQPAHIISHFLPFVFKDPHLAWGLPLAHFQPEAILRHLLSLLKPNGMLIIVNQGQEEADAQHALLLAEAEQTPLRIQTLGQLPTGFIEYRYPRYGWLCSRAH